LIVSKYAQQTLAIYWKHEKAHRVLTFLASIDLIHIFSGRKKSYKILTSPCPHVITPEPLYGFSSNLIPGVGVRFPVGIRNFSLLHNVQAGSAAHPASYKMGTGEPSPSGKRGKGV
jgi:hypothetical protein